MLPNLSRSPRTWILHTAFLAASGFIALIVIISQGTLLLLASMTAAMGLLVLTLKGAINRIASWIIVYVSLYAVLVVGVVKVEYVIILSTVLLAILCYTEELAACVPGAILVLALIALNDASTHYRLAPVLLGMISIITYYITRHKHALALLAAIPASLAADQTVMYMLLASIAVGLVPVYRREDASCPFRLERGLLSIGSFIAAFAIIVYLVAMNLKLSWIPISYILAFWVYGYLLQIAGLLTPKLEI